MTSQSITEDAEVAAGAATIVYVSESRYIVITDADGGARARMLLFNADAPTERLSLSHTRIGQSHLFLFPTSSLVSNRRQVMARLCEDDTRAHDIITSSACELVFDTKTERELEAYGIPSWSMPDPISLFTPVAYDPEGRIERLQSASVPGARFVLVARMNLVCVASVEAGRIRVGTRTRMEAKI